MLIISYPAIRIVIPKIGAKQKRQSTCFSRKINWILMTTMSCKYLLKQIVLVVVKDVWDLISIDEMENYFRIFSAFPGDSIISLIILNGMRSFRERRRQCKDVKSSLLRLQKLSQILHQISSTCFNSILTNFNQRIFKTDPNRGMLRTLLRYLFEKLFLRE